MKKKQSSSAKPPGMIVHHLGTSPGKVLVTVLGQRLPKGNAHHKEIKAALDKEIPPAISKKI